MIVNVVFSVSKSYWSRDMKGVETVNHWGRTFQRDWRPMEQEQVTNGESSRCLIEEVGSACQNFYFNLREKGISLATVEVACGLNHLPFLEDDSSCFVENRM